MPNQVDSCTRVAADLTVFSVGLTLTTGTRLEAFVANRRNPSQSPVPDAEGDWFREEPRRAVGAFPHVLFLNCGLHLLFPFYVAVLVDSHNEVSAVLLIAEEIGRVPFLKFDGSCPIWKVAFALNAPVVEPYRVCGRIFAP